MSTAVRASEEARGRIAEPAEATGRPTTELLDEAMDALTCRGRSEAAPARRGQLREVTSVSGSYVRPGSSMLVVGRFGRNEARRGVDV